jgi:hypothetical protein
MAFNFGAFVGGLSQGVVRGIEDEEQRQHEFEKMAKTEAMRQAAAIRGKRAAKQEATEAAIGALKFLGYNDQAAAAIARQGAVAVEMAVDAGQKAMEKGKDINTMISLPNVVRRNLVLVSLMQKHIKDCMLNLTTLQTLTVNVLHRLHKSKHLWIEKVMNLLN